MTITVAILVTDAAKDAVVAAVNDLTPEYTIGFIRKVCPAEPAPTWQTPTTHWYTNGESVPEDVVATWQTALPEMEGVVYLARLQFLKLTGMGLYEHGIGRLDVRSRSAALTPNPTSPASGGGQPAYSVATGPWA